MRQLANAGHISPKQKALASVAQSSDTGRPQSNFSMHPNQPLCLPVLSLSNKFLWVLLPQIDLKPDAAAELDKAFSKFPYLTLKQTNALAQRCSLHPQLVRVWFMAQRVCYGISWDYTDIREARKHFKSLHKDGGEERSNGPNGEMGKGGKKGSQKDVERGSGGKKWVSANRKKTKIKEVKASVPQKQKEETIAGSRKRGVGKEDDAEKAAEDKRNENENERLTGKSEGGVLTRGRKKLKKEEVNPPHESPVVSGIRLGASPPIRRPVRTLRNTPASEMDLDRADVSSKNSSLDEKTDLLASLDEDPHADATDLNILVTDEDKLKGLDTTDNSGVTADDPPAPIKDEGHVADINAPPAPACMKAERPDQLEKLRAAFRDCQYPDSAQYDLLSETTGISRNWLVRWYGDTRYAIKRSKPRWMNVEDYKQILANIKYRQFLGSLCKSVLSPAGLKTPPQD
nr:homeobox and leucine zipper encoding b [Nothobranchius furzeri]XP_015802285.2 homeobox and leucine zipper encoding b [Nothobranchius furzeri]